MARASLKISPDTRSPPGLLAGALLHSRRAGPPAAEVRPELLGQPMPDGSPWAANGPRYPGSPSPVTQDPRPPLCAQQ